MFFDIIQSSKSSLLAPKNKFNGNQGDLHCSASTSN